MTEAPAWERYEALLLDAMDLEALGDGGRDLGQRVFRGVYQPSFHRDACITVRERGEQGQVELIVASVREQVLQAIGVKMGRPHPVGKATEDAVEQRPETRSPDIQTFAGTVGPSDLEAFASEMAGLRRAELVDASSLGIDGMPVLGEIADGSGVQRFRAWSPTSHRHAEHHRFFAGLHRVASRCLVGVESQVVLEQLHGYLDLGLPLRDLGGTPRHVRLFGRLSHPADPDLVRFFDAAMNDDPLLMDLSNFEGMGTALHPLFRAFDSRPGLTVWCASKAARGHLKAIGIPDDRAVDDVEAARRRLEPR
jgi:hypothetical protein